MIPLKDDIPSRTFPVVTVLLIVLNVVVFLADLSLGGQLSNAFALVPAEVTHAPTAIIPATKPIVATTEIMRLHERRRRVVLTQLPPFVYSGHTGRFTDFQVIATSPVTL